MSDWLTTPGWSLERDERIWLRDAAAWAAEQNGTDAVVVNVGVALGGSVHCLRAGAPGARLVAIDLDNSQVVGDAGAEMVTGDSGAVGRGWQGPVHVLFVDGDHSREGVERDLVAWLPHVADGGLVAFHDFRSPFAHTQGVRQAVEGWDWMGWQFEGAVGSIGFFRKAERPAGFGRLGFGVPYFKPVYRFWQWWSELLIGGMEPDDVFLNGEDVPAEVMIPRAHNALVRAFLETDCETLLMIEDDHHADQGIVRRMRYKPANWGFDAVCASYVNRRGTPWPVGCDFVGQNSDGSWRVRMDATSVAKTGTEQKGCAALGLVLIRRQVLEAMLGDADPKRFDWFRVVGENSQDVYFYARLRALGARVGVDRDNWLRHVGEYDWGREDLEQWLGECEVRKQTLSEVGP